MESIAEAFNKCFVADLIFTLSRTAKDKSADTGRMFVAKNRNGPDGLIHNLFMDTSNVCIKVLPKSLVTASAAGVNQLPQNPLPLNAREQKEILMNRYQKFRKGIK